MFICDRHLYYLYYHRYLYGKLDLHKLENNIEARLANGEIIFTPHQDHGYHYNIKVGNGKTDTFISSDKPDALNVSLEVINGKIKKGSV